MTANLLWCYESTATINAPDRVISVLEGDLVIAPNGAFCMGEGTVCVMEYPSFPKTVGAATRRIHLGAEWNERMLEEFSRNRLGATTPSEEILAVIDAPVTAPVMPRSAAAHAVAQQLVAHPANPAELKEFALMQGVSSRTIQRQFQSETGLVFSEWRAGHRVFVANGLLAGGMTIAEAAELVGFGAASSLTRAFKRHTGTTPRGRVQLHGVPQLAGLTTFARTDTDLVLWMAKGTATVTTSGFCRFVGAGETITLPAQTTMRVDVAADSLALPIPLAEATNITSVSDAVRKAAGTNATMTALVGV